MSLWSCANYTIEKVETKSTTFTLEEGKEGYINEGGAVIIKTNHNYASDSLPATLEVDSFYYVTIQRLPTDTYPETTDIHIVRTDDFERFPLDIGNDALLSNLSASINAEIVAYDAAFDGSAATTPDKTGFTTILPT